MQFVLKTNSTQAFLRTRNPIRTVTYALCSVQRCEALFYVTDPIKLPNVIPRQLHVHRAELFVHNLMTTMADLDIIEHAFYAKGELLGSGAPGIVELLPNGTVVKTPRFNEESRREVKVEAEAYEKISQLSSSQDCFVKIFDFDEDLLILNMEYMSNGTVREYLKFDQPVSRRQRQLWIQKLSRCVEAFHALGIVHGDLTPHNLLLDNDLELKIGDFGGCSTEKSSSAVGTDARFYPQRVSWNAPVTRNDDLLALGSCIYEILNGVAPLHDVASPQARNLVSLQQFPDLTGQDFRDVILDCWLFRAKSAQDIHIRVSDICNAMS